MLLQDQISKKETITKKSWLIFCTTFLLFQIIIDIIFISLPLDELPFPIAEILGSALLLGILYRVSYKKPGTRFLTFIIFLRLLGLIKLFGLIGSFTTQNLGFLYPTLLMVNICLQITWIVLSYKMREINMKIKYFRSVLSNSKG